MDRDLPFDDADDMYSLEEQELIDLESGIDEQTIAELDFRELTFGYDDYALSDPDFSDLEFDDYSDIDPPDLILDVPYVPTDERVVQMILDFAGVTSKDTLFDLGCGDGRIVVAAALERSARGIGVDMDPMRIAEAMEYAGNTGVEHLVDFIEGDLMEIDYSEATVVTLYLLDHVNVQIRPRLLNELRPGTRIVSHAFDMGDWKPDKRMNYGGANLFKWIVPAKVEPIQEWQTEQGDTCRVELKQKYQKLTGKAWINGEPAELKSALLKGDLLELVVQKDANSEAVSLIKRCKSQPKPEE